jgi:DNA-binding IclR family transcriptional regulator
MALAVDPGLVALFGSEDRVRTLAALANEEAPLTAYRVASMVGMKPPNVYRELNRLLRYNEVERAQTPEGRSGWRVIDPDVQALLRRRQRVVWSQDLIRGARERAERAALSMQESSQTPIDLSQFKSGRPLRAIEVRRRRQKDKVLAKAGVLTSVRTTGSVD